MKTPEPWLRRTLSEVHVIQRAVLHALEQAREDIACWCEGLDTQQMNARPSELPSIGFHLRHISHSLDRLLTYAEGRPLSSEQFEAWLVRTKKERVGKS